MANVFNSVKGLHPRRNSFSAHTYRNDFTALLGLNYPVYVQHVTAATRVRCMAHALVRTQALIAPVMDNIDYYLHFWKLPYRLIEADRFTQFISGEIDPADYNALFATPYEFAAELITHITEYEDEDEKIAKYNKIVGNGSLLDFCGYDVDLFPTLSYNADDDEFVLTGGNKFKTFNWRNLIMYFMLHENWYMNENVEYYEGFVEDIKQLVKNQTLGTLCSIISNVYEFQGYTMLPHGWDKDYFTSALPNVQYGSPVTLPLGGSAPVDINPSKDSLNINGWGQIGDRSALFATISRDLTSTNNLYISGSRLFGDNEDIYSQSIKSLSGDDSSFDVSSIDAEDAEGNKISPFVADLSEASAISINEFRFANALQVFKERQLRYGRRRQEYYKGFFDVEPEDLRLQLPKYLGGGRIPINISDVEQTSTNSGSQVLGSLAGKGTAVAGNFAGFKTFCSEESIIMGIAFAMPHVTYSKQVSRFLFKTNDIYDYFNPSFEHLGEQSIENLEVYSGATADGEFGYTPRYNEYRFHSNEMHGQFKDSLSFWSLGRIFDSQPALNADFVYMNPKNFDRIFAVSGVDNLIISMIFNVRLIQPVSKFGTPMLLA